MDYCGIYKFTNKENGKVYIGQSKHIYQRYGLHYNIAFGTKADELLTEFDRALRQTPNAFEFEIIEECAENELNNREQEWIRYYQEQGEVYNTQIIPKVYQFSLTGELIGSYLGYSEAARAVNKPEGKANIYHCCKGTIKTAYGYKWSYTNAITDETNKSTTPSRQWRSVVQMNNEGEVIQTFPSIREAARTMGVSEASIRHACTGRSKSCKGYVWKYNEEEWSV